MSRPRITPAIAEANAREEFRRTVKIRRVYLNMTQAELAEETGVVPSVMSKLLANPDQISIGRLRKIIHAVQIDPAIILALVGYSPKEIKHFQESARYGLQQAASE